MSIDVIVGHLIRRFEEEFAKWRDGLLAKAEAEIRGAAYSVLKEYEHRIRGLQDEVNLEKERMIYDAIMEVKERRLRILEDELSRVISEALAEVKSMRGGERYRRFLYRALRECSEIVGEEMRIVCSKQDRDLVEELAKELKLKVEVVEAGEDLLGIIAESPDGTISVDATVTSKLELVRERAKEFIAKKLWSSYE